MGRRIFHLISNKVWGGGEQYVYDICSVLHSEGEHIEVFHKPIQVFSNKFQSLSIPLHELKLGGFFDFRSALYLSNFLKEGEPCVIHVHNFKDAFTASLSRIIAKSRATRIVMTRHLVRPGKNDFLHRWIYRQIDQFIFVSKLARDTFLTTVPTIQGAKLHVIPNSIRIQDVSTGMNLRDYYAIPSDHYLMMYVGRLAQEKGIEVLIESLHLLSPNLKWRLIIVGTGDEGYTQFLKAKITEYNLQNYIHFIGFQDNVFACIHQSDIGIVPSIVQESSSLTCMEFMSQGKCVIASNNGGQAEYITDGVDGLLVPANQPLALAQTIEKAFSPVFFKSLGKKAQDTFTNCLDYSIFIKKIKEIYE